MNRSAETYADFFLPHLNPQARVLDVGCGDGFAEATANVTFQQSSVYELPFEDGQFDAAFAHSMLETLERPVDGLAELRGLLHDAVRDFGRDRAEQVPGGYTEAALEHGLATKAELAELERAWLVWGESPAAYLAFAWCRAVGVRP